MRLPRTHWREILVGRADDDPFHASVGSRSSGSRGERVVGLKFHHRPDHDSRRRENFFEHGKLCQQFGLDPFRGFVTRPQSISERFDHMIGRHRDVSGATLYHAQQRSEHAPDRAHFVPAGIASGWQRIVVPEQFVRAVDQINVQCVTPTPPYRTAPDLINALHADVIGSVPQVSR